MAKQFSYLQVIVATNSTYLLIVIVNMYARRAAALLAKEMVSVPISIQKPRMSGLYGRILVE
jgi:hypothetical protein